MNLMNELNRCLQCRTKNCQQNCPIGIDIPAIIALSKTNKNALAKKMLWQYDKISPLTTSLCQHPCEKKCVMAKKSHAIQIREIKKTLAPDYDNLVFVKNPTPFKIAIVGGGISGMSLALSFIEAGHDVTIFEKNNHLGGTIFEHVPKFRLEYDLTSIERCITKHASVYYNHILGDNLSNDDLEDFDYVIYALGCYQKNFLQFSSSDVHNALDVLKAYKKDHYYIESQKVLVIGAGNVAIDVARTLIRLGNDVTIVYRRTLEQAPSCPEERQQAFDEGVKFIELCAPFHLIKENHQILGLTVQKNIGYQNEDGSYNIKPLEGNYKEIYADTIVLAVGEKPQYHLIDKYVIQTLADLPELVHKHQFSGDFSYHELGGTVAGAVAIANQTFEKIDKQIKACQKTIDLIKEDVAKRGILFGGSFDPLTKGHLSIINFIYNHISKKLFILPNGSSYSLKQLTSFEERYAMLKRALQGYPELTISALENEQSFEGSYRTLQLLGHPYFVIGSDALVKLPTWRNSDVLIKENNFIVFLRGISYNDALTIINNDEKLKLHRENFTIIPYQIYPISSTQYRLSKDDSIIPSSVKCYLEKHKLY